MIAISPWTTTASELLLEDRWIKLRADRLKTAAGLEIHPWYVLEYPDWCVAVALTPDDRLVLVRQWRHGGQNWSLELPGGVMDPEDADPVAAARRELREETGYDAPDWRYLYASHANPAIQTNRLHVVLGIGAVPVMEASPEPAEDIRVELIPINDVLAGIGGGMIGQAMHIGAILVGLSAAGRINFGEPR